MRRKERELTQKEDLLRVIDNCKVCNIAMQDEMGIYIVPMNFGYCYEEDKLTLFFHSAKVGRKIDALKNNNAVGIEMSCNHQLISSERACGYTFHFSSIIGNGNASFITDMEDGKAALTNIMRHQAGKEFSFDEKAINSVLLFKIEVTSFSGKEQKAN